ncbi:MAG: hypothetical protein ABIG95_03670 [Candidatus Woesearchaeota archaeon]
MAYVANLAEDPARGSNGITETVTPPDWIDFPYVLNKAQAALLEQRLRVSFAPHAWGTGFLVEFTSSAAKAVPGIAGELLRCDYLGKSIMQLSNNDIAQVVEAADLARNGLDVMLFCDGGKSFLAVVSRQDLVYPTSRLGNIWAKAHQDLPES